MFLTWITGNYLIHVNPYCLMTCGGYGGLSDLLIFCLVSEFA